MPRANLKNMKKAIAEAAEIVINKLEAERKTDSGLIESHAEDTKALIDRLRREKTQFENLIEAGREEMNATLNNILAGGQRMIGTIIEAEEARLGALQQHADDINDDGTTIEEPRPKPRLPRP